MWGEGFFLFSKYLHFFGVACWLLPPKFCDGIPSKCKVQILSKSSWGPGRPPVSTTCKARTTSTFFGDIQVRKLDASNGQKCLVPSTLRMEQHCQQLRYTLCSSSSVLWVHQTCCSMWYVCRTMVWQGCAWADVSEHIIIHTWFILGFPTAGSSK